MDGQIEVYISRKKKKALRKTEGAQPEQEEVYKCGMFPGSSGVLQLITSDVLQAPPHVIC